MHLRCALAVAACALLLHASAYARNTLRQLYLDTYSEQGYTLLGTRITNVPSNTSHCGLCHYDFNGGGPRNPVGDEVAASIAPYGNNQTTEKKAALWADRLNDPDGDGYSTFIELTDLTAFANTPTFPGLTPSNIASVNNVNTADIETHLVPSTGSDTTPPSVAVTAPNGGQTLTANLPTTITWSASDASGIAGVDIYLSLDGGATSVLIAGGLTATLSHTWHPANRPSINALITVVATDNAGNSAADDSDAVFTIESPPGGIAPTTLRDFDMPGTQPLENNILPLASPTDCSTCHGGYDPATEPHHNWQGSMMAHASIDPLFEALMVIANQDAPESGDLCLRCHNARGWLDGRSTPTDGSLMTDADRKGVSCDLCHRMVDPDYTPGTDPVEDFDILAALRDEPTEEGNGMYVIDPLATRRGPFDDTEATHSVIVSPYHESSAHCGTCHDVSNPVFEKDPAGGSEYLPATFDEAPTDTAAHTLMPVERTYSEWLYSAFNTPTGLERPEFAGNKPGGYVATCQDCHMRDVTGYGANNSAFPLVPQRDNLPLHDMTGGSTWLPALLPALHPGEVDATAINDGIARARNMLTNALDLSLFQKGDQLKVHIVNRTGHKLPTGYPEGRRVWINVEFYDESHTLIAESGAYDETTGILTPDPALKIYEAKPGIGPALATALSLPGGPSFHFVLNNQIFKDNRIPPQGFTNTAYTIFGGQPVGHTYADGQFWDDTYYDIPPGADHAEVHIYYQSTSKEFIEFLRDENTTDSKGQDMYDLWNNNGKCPPELMAEAEWLSGFVVTSTYHAPTGEFHIQFTSRIGREYEIQYADTLAPTASDWQPFQNNGHLTATAETSEFIDDHTAATSGSAPAQGRRFYRVTY